MHLKLSILENENENESLSFIPHDKCKNTINKKRTILQIIDVSEKLLFNDLKAEYEFHSMMNATVSHELRNPLNSLIG